VLIDKHNCRTTQGTNYNGDSNQQKGLMPLERT
jgi:hypothetical protein